MAIRFVPHFGQQLFKFAAELDQAHLGHSNSVIGEWAPHDREQEKNAHGATIHSSPGRKHKSCTLCHLQFLFV
jgi:hypothetical protein